MHADNNTANCRNGGRRRSDVRGASSANAKNDKSDSESRIPIPAEKTRRANSWPVLSMFNATFIYCKHLDLHCFFAPLDLSGTQNLSRF